MDQAVTPTSSIEARQTPMSARVETGAPSSCSSSKSSSSSSLKPPLSSRRSLARNPRLLGLDESRVLELRGFGISSSASSAHVAHPTSSASSNFSRARTPMTEDHTEDSIDSRFRIDEDEQGLLGTRDVETEEPTELTSADVNSIMKSRQSNDCTRKNPDMLAPIRVDSYAPLDGYQAEQGEHTAILYKQQRADGQLDNGGNDSIDIERNASVKYNYNNSNNNNNYEQEHNQDEEEEEDLNTTLYFEPTTPREKLWMWTSVGLVATLTLVSIAIAVDWIDWPGDGIGKD